MHTYPIFQHLKQFSNLIDENGRLFPQHVRARMGQGQAPTKDGEGNSTLPPADAMPQQLLKTGEDELEGGENDGAQGAPAKVNGQMGVQQPGMPNFPVGDAAYPAGQVPTQQTNGQVGELPPSANKARWQRNYDLLDDKDRQEMLVDEIFALYLYRMSNRINFTYYRIVLAYVIFFRECLNEYGWGKKIESESIKLESRPDLKQEIANKQFCLVNNAEHAPEICNELVTVYMEYKKSIFEIPKHDQIDLTINLCHWLFQCQFTCSKLSLIG